MYEPITEDSASHNDKFASECGTIWKMEKGLICPPGAAGCRVVDMVCHRIGVIKDPFLDVSHDGEDIVEQRYFQSIADVVVAYRHVEGLGFTPMWEAVCTYGASLVRPNTKRESA